MKPTSYPIAAAAQKSAPGEKVGGPPPCSLNIDVALRGVNAELCCGDSVRDSVSDRDSDRESKFVVRASPVTLSVRGPLGVSLALQLACHGLSVTETVAVATPVATAAAAASTSADRNVVRLDDDNTAVNVAVTLLSAASGGMPFALLFSCPLFVQGSYLRVCVCLYVCLLLFTTCSKRLHPTSRPHLCPRCVC